MSVEYGSDLQGSLLEVAHEICEHEREFGLRGLSRTFQWEQDTIALNPAFLDTAGEGFHVISAVFCTDSGDTQLHVHDTTNRSIEDGDWYAEDILTTFKKYLEHHTASEHELCIAALEARRPQRPFPRLKSPFTGEILLD